MKPPSKRTVRDAIRILGYAAQHGCGVFDATDALGSSYEDAYELTVAARLVVAHDDGVCIGSGICAAAENLLREGWLP